MNELEQLKKENAELLRAIARLGGTIEKLLNIFNHFKNEKPRHLADIEANAQQECLAAIRTDLGNHISKATEIGEIDFLLSLRFTDRIVQEYASKLRGESK